MGDKDFPRLRADANFKKLSAAHQALLLEACGVTTVLDSSMKSHVPPPSAEREADALLLCTNLVEQAEVVRGTLLEKVKTDVRALRTLLCLSETPSFKRPRLNDAPAAGGAIADCQRRLIQVFAFLRERELLARKEEIKTVIRNTIEWFFFMGLPIELADGDSLALALYDRQKHKIVLFHDSLLKITPEGVGGRKETLRKLTHEVNHACRRTLAGGDVTQMIDEVWAFVTELIADDQYVSSAQMNETKEKLAKPPYNLKTTIASKDGKAFWDSLKFRSEGFDERQFPLDRPSLRAGSGGDGWNHTNAVPGL